MSYRTYTSQVVRYEKIDGARLALWTAEPFSMLPYLLSRVFIVSPTQYAKAGDWLRFQDMPSGTGPFRQIARTPRVSFELARNEEYWDRGRVPKVDRILLRPIPDPSTRVAALRSGEVDWIECPPPDGIASLKAAGFQVVTAAYPHVWAWHAANTDGSPLHDRRVRLALNYGLDRDGLVEFLAGTAIPARGPLARHVQVLRHAYGALPLRPGQGAGPAGAGGLRPQQAAGAQGHAAHRRQRQHGPAAHGGVRAAGFR